MGWALEEVVVLELNCGSRFLARHSRNTAGTEAEASGSTRVQGARCGLVLEQGPWAGGRGG